MVSEKLIRKVSMNTGIRTGAHSASSTSSCHGRLYPVSFMVTRAGIEPSLARLKAWRPHLKSNGP